LDSVGIRETDTHPTADAVVAEVACGDHRRIS